MAAVDGHFGISSKLRELMCLVGQGYVFEEGEEILSELLGIEVGAKQLQRVSEHYGEAIELEEEKVMNGEKKAKPLTTKKKDEPVYFMLDGSMVFIRGVGWKEIKVGRIFSGSNCIAVQAARNEIVQSLYLCHLGDHEKFLRKWEPYIDGYRQKVFIADGAKWIWRWVEDTYPEAVQILDYFHAVEKIAEYAKWQYTEEKQRKQWMDMQCDRLVNDKVKEIISALEKEKGINQEAEKARVNTLSYYAGNIKRMMYKTFTDKGYDVGSGAIESAHRNVVQQRLKLSGQRWSLEGAQRIVNLRAYKKSNRWDEVKAQVRLAA